MRPLRRQQLAARAAATAADDDDNVHSSAPQSVIRAVKDPPSPPQSHPQQLQAQSRAPRASHSNSSTSQPHYLRRRAGCSPGPNAITAPPSGEFEDPSQPLVPQLQPQRSHRPTSPRRPGRRSQPVRSSPPVLRSSTRRPAQLLLQPLSSTRAPPVAEAPAVVVTTKNDRGSEPSSPEPTPPQTPPSGLSSRSFHGRSRNGRANARDDGGPDEDENIDNVLPASPTWRRQPFLAALHGAIRGSSGRRRATDVDTGATDSMSWHRRRSAAAELSPVVSPQTKPPRPAYGDTPSRRDAGSAPQSPVPATPPRVVPPVGSPRSRPIPLPILAASPAATSPPHTPPSRARHQPPPSARPSPFLAAASPLSRFSPAARSPAAHLLPPGSSSPRRHGLAGGTFLGGSGSPRRRLFPQRPASSSQLRPSATTVSAVANGQLQVGLFAIPVGLADSCGLWVDPAVDGEGSDESKDSAAASPPQEPVHRPNFATTQPSTSPASLNKENLEAFFNAGCAPLSAVPALLSSGAACTVSTVPASIAAAGMPLCGSLAGCVTADAASALARALTSHRHWLRSVGRSASAAATVATTAPVPVSPLVAPAAVLAADFAAGAAAHPPVLGVLGDIPVHLLHPTSGAVAITTQASTRTTAAAPTPSALARSAVASSPSHPVTLTATPRPRPASLADTPLPSPPAKPVDAAGASSSDSPSLGSLRRLQSGLLLRRRLHDPAPLSLPPQPPRVYAEPQDEGSGVSSSSSKRRRLAYGGDDSETRTGRGRGV